MKKQPISLTKVLLISLSSLIVLFTAASCTEDEKDYGWSDDWVDNTVDPDKPNPDGDGDEDTDNPNPGTPNPDEDSRANAPRFVWIDASANFPDYHDSKENIAIDVQKAYNAGFTDLVVDVRTDNGDILYESSHGDHVDWLAAWLPSGYSKVYWSGDFDYLQAFIDAADALGMRVHAGFNTFLGGKEYAYGLGNSGALYNGLDKDFASSLNLEQGITNIMDAPSDVKQKMFDGALFLNPVHEGVQEYLINLLTDLAINYPGLESIILDRGRFGGIASDFSDYTREKFEDYIGEKVVSWPSDVLPAGHNSYQLPSPAPKHMGEWLTFRAKTIHDFMEKASTAIREANTDIKVGAYVGGWYSTYYDVGVNWAAPTYSTSTRESLYKSWARREYNECGYADNMDIMLIGAYTETDRLYGSNEWTIQGFCSRAKEKIGSACPTIAGGPDLNFWANKGYNQTDAVTLSDAVGVTVDACGGFFLFDMVHLKLSAESNGCNLWDYIKVGVDDLAEEE